MPGNNLVQSLERAISIMHAVAGQDGGLSLSDIAGRLSLKTSTAHNLLRTLTARDFLMRGPEGRYSLGSALLTMAGRHAHQSYYGQVEKAVRELADRLARTVVTYVELEHDQLVVRMRMSPDQPGVVQRPGAMPYALYAKATGLAALAFADPETLADLRQRHPFYEQGVQLWGSLEKLNAFLAKVRKDGYASVPFEEPGFYRAAAVILDRDGAMRGLLGISVILPDELQSQAIDAARACLLEQAAEIAGRLQNE